MTIRIGASEVGGTFYTQALALKDVFRRARALPSADVVESQVGASIENAIRLDTGELDFAFVSAPWVAAASKGVAPFSRAIDLKTVAPMNLGPNFFVVRADSNLHNVGDLRGKKLAIGLKTGGMMPHANAVLKAIGLGLNDVHRVYVDFAEGAQMLMSGEVDAQYQRPIPNRVMTELSEQIQVRVLRYGPKQIEAALEAIPYDRATLMRKGAVRGLDEDILQLGVLNLLVAHARADEGTVRLVAQTVIENTIELGVLVPLFAGLRELMDMTRKERCASLEFDGVTLHPGAVRAYADAGFI